MKLLRGLSCRFTLCYVILSYVFVCTFIMFILRLFTKCANHTSFFFKIGHIFDWTYFFFMIGQLFWLFFFMIGYLCCEVLSSRVSCGVFSCNIQGMVDFKYHQSCIKSENINFPSKFLPWRIRKIIGLYFYQIGLKFASFGSKDDFRLLVLCYVIFYFKFYFL